MPGLPGLPPGRAGRTWLRRRLATAERGADLLDRKLRILRIERQRLALMEARTAVAWDEAAREATRWSRRAGLVEGRRAFRVEAGQPPAEVVTEWGQVMGIRYPVEATCVLPPVDPTGPPRGSAALVSARTHQVALQAAVQHAAAQSAVRILDAEIAVTRRRLRAVEERWLPRLHAAAADLDLVLDEQEHADGVRLRWGGRRGR